MPDWVVQAGFSGARPYRTVRSGRERCPELNMFTVYVLKDKEGKFYKGVTNNLSRRLKKHRYGDTKTTRSMSEFIVVYSEGYDNFKKARGREIYLKTSAGRRFLKKIFDKKLVPSVRA